MQPIAYRSAGSRARLATAFLTAYVTGNCVFTIGHFTDFAFLQSNPAVEVLTALVVVFYGVVIGTVVFVCAWLHRIVGNMPGLGAVNSVWTAASAVTWCFIPFGFFVQPMWSVLDAWRGADASARQIDLNSQQAHERPAVLVAWWLLWLLAACCGLVAAKAAGTVGSILSALATISFTAAALLCILVIRDVTERQDRKNELIASGQLR